MTKFTTNKKKKKEFTEDRGDPEDSVRRKAWGAVLKTVVSIQSLQYRSYCLIFIFIFILY